VVYNHAFGDNIVFNNFHMPGTCKGQMSMSWGQPFTVKFNLFCIFSVALVRRRTKGVKGQGHEASRT